VDDIDGIIAAAGQTPPTLPSPAQALTKGARRLRLTKITAHRFGGLHAYGGLSEAPEDFEFTPQRPITLFEGWNGSGKTSLLNAVIWCLTGQLLRPQRRPERASEEFECRIPATAQDVEEDAEEGSEKEPRFTFHRLTPVTPLPDPTRFKPSVAPDRLPIDTWVELRFVDEQGNSVPPVRRSQTRSTRGGIQETPPQLDALGIEPIATSIGTSMPGVLPFIQLGAVSDLGAAVSQFTGLADLVTLSRHAKRVQQRIVGETKPATNREIAVQEAAFLQTLADLQAILAEVPSIGEGMTLPQSAEEPSAESAIDSLIERFATCKANAFTAAIDVLGPQFDPNDKSARDTLEATIGPARAQLKQLGKLPSAIRLASLGKLTETECRAADELIAKVVEEAGVLSELAATPDLARRTQLYARVAAWMIEHDRRSLDACAVCFGPLAGAVDSTTGRAVAAHVEEALAGDADLVAKSIGDWAQSWSGRLAQSLPEPLAQELRRDLPSEPAEMIRTAIITELFETPEFIGPLTTLKASAATLCNQAVSALPIFEEPSLAILPEPLLAKSQHLLQALHRIDRALAFARWRQQNQAGVRSVAQAVLGASEQGTTIIDVQTPLGDKLAALHDLVTSAAPITQALELCDRMKAALKKRGDQEERLKACDRAVLALDAVIGLGDLAERQVEGLKEVLQSRAVHWCGRLYNNAYAFAGHELVEAAMDSKGAISFLVGSEMAAAPAQHISNASALRAIVFSFYLAFWEHVFETHGGLALLTLDDPQELLDDDNSERLARALTELASKAGAQLILTTYDRRFARLLVAEGRKSEAIEHRSVHPVNVTRDVVETAPAVEELDRKRALFEGEKDKAEAAQDYASQARIFVEARLTDLFDSPAYPAYSAPSKAPTLSDHLGRLRGLVSQPPNELFRKSAIIALSRDSALQEGAPCLAALNKSHHNKAALTYKGVWDVRDDLRRVRRLAEDAHEVFRLWRWTEIDSDAAKTSVVIQPGPKLANKVLVFPDLAAFVGSAPVGETQSEAEFFDEAWFDDKAFFFVRNENLGFAAPSGSLVVVECDPTPCRDRNLVIGLYGDSVFARRLLRAKSAASRIALAAETPDPRKSPPTLTLDPALVQLHRVVGVVFDDVSPPPSKEEAVNVEAAPALRKVEVAYRVKGDSALPLALPGQLVLGGGQILPAELDAHDGAPVALVLTDGSAMLKRAGPRLPGKLSAMRKFESIGGLGGSEVVLTEEVEDPLFAGVPIMAHARLVLGVLYDA
jgi:hypothetical protein